MGDDGLDGASPFAEWGCGPTAVPVGAMVDLYLRGCSHRR
jgi:hypothetical protein